MSVSNSMPKVRAKLAAVPSVPMGETKLIADRLDKQYGRIFQVIGIVHTLKMAVHGKDESGEDDDLGAMWSSLDLAQDMLLDIADQIEMPSLLKPEVAHAHS